MRNTARAFPVASKLAKMTLAMLVVLVVAGCSSLSRVPVPEDLVLSTHVPSDGPPALLRYWGDDLSATDHEFQTSSARIRELTELARSPRLDFLSLSGGGYNGAFGTGYLLGWSARGDRPQFRIVTGISVGALLAPFAFLGEEYDQPLLAAFDGLAMSKAQGSGLLGAFFGAPGVESNEPIKNAIAQVITDETLSAIGEEHRKGRRLLIGTTNLDVERPVVWDIGAIALSSVKDKTALVRKILLASSAVPGVYAPVLIDVEAHGKRYSELHVDGGVTQQVVLVPDDLTLRRYDTSNTRRNRNLYIIYNGKLTPSYQPAETSALGVLKASVPTFIKYLGRADIKRMQAAAEKNGARYKLTAIPEEFKTQNNFTPDPEYLATLIKLGYEMGKSGDWEK